MNLVILGSGNVATILSRLLVKAGQRVMQVFSRDPDHAARLAAELATDAVSELHQIRPDADIYLIALSDDALLTLPGSCHFGKKLVLHTAGSVSQEFLSLLSRNYGVLYPLQSLRRESSEIPVIPLLVDANTTENLTLVTDIAGLISPQVHRAGDEERAKLHLASVIVNNFGNHLYTLAETFCREEKIPFSLLGPLIDETARRIRWLPPQSAQTGPAARGDHQTIEKHLEYLRGYPETRRIYEIMTQSILSGKL
jgi:predicted short-subunit dehydrogenase-like oxidoreductase (DUF2520 family)